MSFLARFNPFRNRRAEQAAERAAAEAKRKADQAAADQIAWLDARHKAGDDEYRRINYYQQFDFDRWIAAGRPPVIDGGPDTLGSYAHDWHTPPPTDAQWAKLTPEQKAAPGSVLPENLP